MSRIEKFYADALTNLDILISMALAAGKDKEAAQLIDERYELLCDRELALWEAANG
jgi:hypothetical protein